MSRKWVKERAANVRSTWSRDEREQRAMAGERRRRELLARLGFLIDCRDTSSSMIKLAR
jgi:hypothetical protein